MIYESVTLAVAIVVLSGEAIYKIKKWWTQR